MAWKHEFRNKVLCGSEGLEIKNSTSDHFFLADGSFLNLAKKNGTPHGFD